MNQSVIINILLKADQTQAGAAAFNNVLKDVVKAAQQAGRQIRDALNAAFSSSNGKDLSAQAKLLQSLANLTNAQAKQEAQQNRIRHAQTVAQGKIELEQVKALNKARQQASQANSPLGQARAATAAANAETAAVRSLTAAQQHNAAASRAQAAASAAQAAQARAATSAATGAANAQAAQARAQAAQLRLQNLQNPNSNVGGGSIFAGTFAANLATKAISLVTQTLKDGAAAVFEYSARLEQNKVAFTRLLGSASAANSVLQVTQSLTAQTGLSFEAVARRILNTGQSVETTLPLIETLGKAIVGAGKSQGELERIGLVIEQIISAQRLLGQDANQLKELGFNAYKIIGDEIGKTSAEVRQLAQDGKISSDLFVTAFEKFINKKYATAFSDQTKSLSGSLTVLAGKLTQLASQGSGEYFQILSEEASKAAKSVQASSNLLRASVGLVNSYLGTTGRISIQLGRDVVDTIATIPELLSDIGEEIANTIVPLEGVHKESKSFLQTVDSILAQLSKIPIVGNAIGFVGGIFLEIASIFDTVENNAKGLTAGLRNAAQAIEDAKKKADALREAKLEQTLEAADDILRDLQIRLAFFGDNSEVAAVKQDLLRKNIDLATNASARQAVELAGLLDAKQKDLQTTEKLTSANKNYIEAIAENKDARSTGNLTRFKILTDETTNETNQLQEQLKVRRQIADIRSGANAPQVRLETEELTHIGDLLFQQLKTRRQIFAIQQNAPVIQLDAETKELQEQADLLLRIFESQRRLIDLRDNGRLTQLEAQNQALDTQVARYREIRSLLGQLELPQATIIPTDAAGQITQQGNLGNLLNLRNEIVSSNSEITLALEASANQSGELVTALDKVNAQIEVYTRLRQSPLTAGDTQLFEDARRRAAQLDFLTQYNQKIQGINESYGAFRQNLVDLGKAANASLSELQTPNSLSAKQVRALQNAQIEYFDPLLKKADPQGTGKRTVFAFQGADLTRLQRITDNLVELRLNRNAGYVNTEIAPTEIKLLNAVNQTLSGLQKLLQPDEFNKVRDDVVGFLRTTAEEIALARQKEATADPTEKERQVRDIGLFRQERNKNLQRGVVADLNLEFQNNLDSIAQNQKLLEFLTQKNDTTALFAETRRNTQTLQEQVSLELQLQQIEDARATSGLNQALRIRLATESELLAIHNADLEAQQAIAVAEVKLADARIYHADQANAKVLDFLASQRTLTDVISDSKIGVIKTVYDTIDTGLDKLTKHLKLAGDLVKELLSGFIKLALNKYFQQAFGLAPNTGGGNRGGGGGGIAQTLFGALTGGFGGGGVSVGPGGTAVFNPGAPAFFGGAKLSAGLFGLGSNAPLAPALPGPGGTGGGGIGGIGGTAAGRVLSGGKFSLGGLGNALGPIAPLLGLSLGVSAGGPSRAGSVLGGIGGLALGGTALAFLAPGLLTGLLGGTAGASTLAGAGAAGLSGLGAASGLGGAAIGLLTNPFTIAAGVGLLIGAVLLGRNSKRRAAEKQSTQIRTDAKSKLQDILSQVKKGQLPTASAIQQANAIRAAYLDEVGKIKDKKTRNIGLTLVRELDAIIAQIKSEGARQDQAKELDKIIVPTFATGGAANFQRYNGLVGDRGLGAGDVIPALINRDETVINATQRARLGGVEAMRLAGVPGYGTVAPPPVAPTPALSSGGSFANSSAPGGFDTFMAVIVADEQTADDFISRAKPGTFAKKIVLARREDPGFIDRLFG